jgi:hypothetical protein
VVLEKKNSGQNDGIVIAIENTRALLERIKIKNHG